MAPTVWALLLNYPNDPLSPKFIGEPGAPTAWHGAALNDYHALHTARCFATGFVIFVVHWYLYVKTIHGLPSAALRLALSALATSSYFVAVLTLHPWQPYWIRELSVMLAQLYGWKVADLALLRHGEALRPFWPFLLFDVLVLRPPALVLPGSSTGSSAGGGGGGGEDATAGGAGAGGAADKDGGQLGVGGRRHGPQHVPSGASASPLGLATAVEATATTAGAVARPGQATAPAAVTALSGKQRRAPGRRRAVGDAAAAIAADCAPAPTPSAAVAVQARAGPAAAAPPGPAPGRPARGGLLLLPRLLLAARVVVAGPLPDFAVAYCCCEAANAYLMHRRPEDILAAPYPQQVLLSCCFAAALYCHLSYFFFSMEMLWLAGFEAAAGVRLPRWQPLFNSPQRSTSPVDFWNNRWHQAFRWWWTRLVYVPVRRALRHGLDGLQRRYGVAGSEGGGAGGGEAGGGGGGGDWGSGGQEAQQQQDQEEEEGAEGRRDGKPHSGGAGAATAGAVGGRAHVAAHAHAHVRVHAGPQAHAHAHVHMAQHRASKRGKGADSAPAGKPAGKQAGGSASFRSGSGRHSSGGGSSGGSNSGGSSSSSSSSSRSLGARLARWLLARRRGLLAAVPTVAVFGFSAAFHESLLWINFGRPTGEQAAFFLLHAAILLLQRAVEAAAASPRGPAPLRLLRSAHARLPRPLRAAACLALLASTSPLFFRPWFAASYHRELRVLAYGPTQWAVRVWVLGRPAESVRLFW